MKLLVFYLLGIIYQHYKEGGWELLRITLTMLILPNFIWIHISKERATGSRP